MYTHNLDPVLFDFGLLVIRWYSLAYIFGILIGWWLGKKIIKNIVYNKNFNFKLNKNFQSFFLKNKSCKTINPKLIENSHISKLCILENKRILNKHLFSIVHDEDWFKWRLLDSPYKSNIYIFEKNKRRGKGCMAA